MAIQLPAEFWLWALHFIWRGSNDSSAQACLAELGLGWPCCQHLTDARAVRGSAPASCSDEQRETHPCTSQRTSQCSSAPADLQRHARHTAHATRPFVCALSMSLFLARASQQTLFGSRPTHISSMHSSTQPRSAHRVTVAGVWLRAGLRPVCGGVQACIQLHVDHEALVQEPVSGAALPCLAVSAHCQLSEAPNQCVPLFV